MKRYAIILLLIGLLCSMTGCQKFMIGGLTFGDEEAVADTVTTDVDNSDDSDETDVVETDSAENDSAIEDEAITDSDSTQPTEVQEESNITPVQIIVLNLTNVDIGMFSIIDPGSKEQLQISQLDQNCSLTIDINWPKGENMFAWALYNKNGELCVEGSSDLTGMTESASIVFTGDGNVDEIEVDIK